MNFDPTKLARHRSNPVVLAVYGVAVALAEGQWYRYVNAGADNTFGFPTGSPVSPPVGYGSKAEPERVYPAEIARILNVDEQIVDRVLSDLIEAGAIAL